jgi:hypothetical protein
MSTNQNIHELSDDQFDEFNKKISIATSNRRDRDDAKGAQATLVRSQSAIDEQREADRLSNKHDAKGSFITNKVKDYSSDVNEDIFTNFPKESGANDSMFGKKKSLKKKLKLDSGFWNDVNTQNNTDEWENEAE